MTTKQRTLYTLGPAGSFSSQGTAHFFAQFPNQTFDIQFCSSFPDIFESVKNTPDALGIVPIQNGSTSSIHENVDMFFQNTQLRIWAEFFLPVQLHLLGLPGAQSADITDIYSHPKAIDQCQEFLDSFKGKTHYTKSTAAAAEHIIQSNNTSAGVLGSKSLIQKGLCLLKENVHTHKKNKTQFIVFGAQKSKPNLFSDGDKWTVHFECQHKPGALSEVLSLLAEKGANLMKIESRPIPGADERFRFWIDIDASNASASLYKSIQKATLDCSRIGTYEIGQEIHIDTPEANLEILRNQIDHVDEKIIHLLAHRQHIVESIAKEKQKLNTQTHQPKRFEQMMKKRIDQAQKKKLEATYIKKIYDVIHEASINHQNTLKTS